MIASLFVPLSTPAVSSLQVTYLVGNRLVFCASILEFSLCALLFISVVGVNAAPLVSFKLSLSLPSF